MHGVQSQLSDPDHPLLPLILRLPRIDSTTFHCDEARGLLAQEHGSVLRLGILQLVLQLEVRGHQGRFGQVSQVADDLSDGQNATHDV